MTVPNLHVLWSVPRGRSTAFFRMILERNDFLCLHEPFCELQDLGHVELPNLDGDIVPFSDMPSAIEHVAELSRHRKVFVKETTEYDYAAQFSSRLFGENVQSIVLFRKPSEVVPSHIRKHPIVDEAQLGFGNLLKIVEHQQSKDRRLCFVQSEELVRDTEGTVRRFCENCGLQFLPDSLTWTPGHRREWKRTERWHTEVARTAGFCASKTEKRKLTQAEEETAKRLIEAVTPDYLQLVAMEQKQNSASLRRAV